MSNYDNIKELRIPGATPGSLGGGSAFLIGSGLINGEILSVGWKTNITPGSIFLVASGTEGAELIWGAKAGSVAAYTYAYPRVFPVDNTNTLVSGAGGTVVPRATATVVMLGGSAPDGGSIAPFIIRFR